MIHAPLAILIALLPACGLHEVLPGPPVATGAARAAFEESRAPLVVRASAEGPNGDGPNGDGPNGDGSNRQEFAAPIQYSTEPIVPFPVLPLQVWGLRYALDVVLVSDHPDWVMHEYARIDLPTGSVWMAKDAGVNREQTIVADIPDIATWVPEVPVRRISAPLDVQTSSEDGQFFLAMAYTNPLGQATEIGYRGPLPTVPSNPRNGNTMGHSRQSVAALLDLFLFRIGGKATIRIDGVDRGIERLLGILPQTYLLAQVQGGFAVTNFRQEASEAGFRLIRPGGSEAWPTTGDEAWIVGEDGWVSREGPVVTLRYRFVDGELERAVAVQAGDPTPLVTMVFSPRLPDIRRRFEGIAVSNFVIDVNGQSGHGLGEISTSWAGGEVHISIAPTAPHWLADRPMQGRVRYEGGAAYVTMERADVDPR